MKPPDQNAANPAKQREPNGSVVSATRCNELAQQADRDSGNDYSDDFHDVSLLQPATSPASYLHCARQDAVPSDGQPNDGESGHTGPRPSEMRSFDARSNQPWRLATV